MRTNTMVTLGASAAFGIMAVVLARGWINGAVQDEFRNTRGANTSQSMTLDRPAVPTTAVIVANADLMFGDELTPDVVRVVEMPEDAVPMDALTDMSDLFALDYDPMTAGALIALSDIRMNEIILPHRVSGLGGRASLSARIRTGYRAVSVRVDDVTGVSGFIMPGDLVDIQYLTEPNINASKQNFRSDIILQSVRVLAVDQTQNQQLDSASVARTITLEVSHMDAQALAVAQETGLLSLVLRAAGEAMPSTTRSLDSRELDRRANSLSSTKKPKRHIKVTPKKAPPPVAQITVIRGDSTQSVSVRREDQPKLSSSELAGG